MLIAIVLQPTPVGAVQQDPALSSNREAHQHRDKMQQSKNQVCCPFR